VIYQNVSWRRGSVDITSARRNEKPGPNPTIASYNATGSLVCFENKKYFLLIWKNALAYYNAGVVAVNLKIVGSAPGFKCIGFEIFSWYELIVCFFTWELKAFAKKLM
jgi:hypothetical protein